MQCVFKFRVLLGWASGHGKVSCCARQPRVSCPPRGTTLGCVVRQNCAAVGDPVSDVLEGCLSTWMQLLANVLLLRSSAALLSGPFQGQGCQQGCECNAFSQPGVIIYDMLVQYLVHWNVTFLSTSNKPRSHTVYVPFMHLSVLLPVLQGPRVGSWATLAFGALAPDTFHREQLEWLMLGIKANFWGFLQSALPFCIGSKRGPTFQQCQHPETLLATLPIPMSLCQHLFLPHLFLHLLHL